MRDELNDFGIRIQDAFLLDYYGVKVFFRVCGTTKDSVFLVELAQKRTKWGIQISRTLKGSKNPLVVLKGNDSVHSRYEAFPESVSGSVRLPIRVDYGDPLHREAMNYAEFPACGYAYAVPLNKPMHELLDMYWEVSEKVNFA